MTDNEKYSVVKIFLDNDTEATDELIGTYLALAKSKILNALYPYNSDKTTVPSKYSVLQCELAVWLYCRRGGEGEESHNENGITRKYLSENAILSQVTPIAGI